MEPFRYHVYACEQKKPFGAPSCTARGSVRVVEALRRELGAAGLADIVQVTSCGSLGLCESGPNMVVYPEGVWYSGVQPEDVPEIVREHFQNGRVIERLANRDAGAVRAEIETNKMKRMAALKARDAAGMLPDDLQGTIRGFQESRVLLTAVELDVFSAVGDGANADEVARALETDLRATAFLLNALVALEVLVKAGDIYRNAPVATRYLAAGSRDDARAALMHTVHLWPRWSTLTDCVREGTSVTYQKVDARDDDWTTAFIAAMHRNAAARAPLVVRTVGADGVLRLLDVGGGSGAYSIAFARANPNLHAEVFDLASVVPIAQRHIDEAGLSDRITTRVGDLRSDDFGNDYDLVLLSAICHMNSPDENRDLLARAARALAPGGRVVIQDFILEPDHTAPKHAALFALNMLVGTPAGGTYTASDYVDWLDGAGFADARHARLPGPTGLVIGRRLDN